MMGARFLIQSKRVSILIGHRYSIFGQARLLKPIQRLAFFACVCVAWFNANGRLGDRNERQNFGGRYP
jgi:hypothetical protein